LKDDGVRFEEEVEYRVDEREVETGEQYDTLGAKHLDRPSQDFGKHMMPVRRCELRP
jgi:hypothetical protein